MGGEEKKKCLSTPNKAATLAVVPDESVGRGKLISHKLIDFRVRAMSTCLLASRKPLSASVSVSTSTRLIFTVDNCGCRGSTAAKGAASSSRAT